MKMKNVLLAVILSAGGAFAAAPTVEVTSTAVGGDGAVTVGYTLSGADAIVTFDVLADDGSGTWTSIGGENVTGGLTFGRALGAVMKRVAVGDRTFTWTPSLVWKERLLEGADIKVEVKAWPLTCPPDYLAVRLTPGLAANDRVSFYPAAEFVPGGVLSNAEYRLTTVLMRKIPAYGKSWKRLANNNYPVTNDHDYYMGVFELTCGQWEIVYGTGITHSQSAEYGYKQLMPMNKISYRHIRESADGTADETHMYPADPHPDSYLGKLRTLTTGTHFQAGIDFDLPSEADWEYTAWNDYPGGYWGDGTVYDGSTDGNHPGRYFRSCTTTGIPLADGDGKNMAIVGCYRPSDWGLYDLHGNLREYCLDWYAADADLKTLGGAVNADGKYLIDGETEGAKRIARGGCYAAHGCYSHMTSRTEPQVAHAPDAGLKENGFRLWCKAGIDNASGDAASVSTGASVSVSGIGGNPTRAVVPALETRTWTAFEAFLDDLRTGSPGFLLFLR